MSYDTDDFATDVLERSYTTPVLVDFWAAWCGPCRVLGPVLERLAQQADGKWALAKIDTERHRSIAAKYRISSIPNVKLFVDGEVKDEFVGALPEPMVMEWLGKALPSKYRVQLEAARQLQTEHRADSARQMLETIVAAEPDNDQATVLLAQALLGSDPERALKTVGPVKLGSQYFEAAQGIRTLTSMFAHLDDPQRLPDDPVKETYLKSVADARAGDFEAALDGFVAVIRKNRRYDDDGSRKACIAIYKLLGEDHQITRSHRPALSGALY